MNRQLGRLGAAFLVCYLALFAMLNVHTVINADERNEDPRNTRPVVRDFSRPRGYIQTADGVLVAESVPVETRFELLRRYPEGELYAHTVGHVSFLYGTEGVERSYNDALAGRDEERQLRDLGNILTGEVATADLTLTLRDSVQRVARDALGQREGAVVALDPRDGQVLALWSFPSYDPNPLAAHDLEATEQARSLLLLDGRKPLVPGTYRERYFPGSTFKIVTAATALAANLVSRDQPVYEVRSAYTPPQTTRAIGNSGGGSCGGNLIQIIRISCTTAFAEMGVQLGAERLVAGAEAFGFNDVPPIDLPDAAVSAFPPVEFFQDNAPLLAQSAFGQNEVQATPLQMALVAAAIGNGGDIPTPHVVGEVRDADGELIREVRPDPWREDVITPAHAAVLRDAMVEVVRSGTATSLQIPGVEVAAKTGTAQLGTDPPSSHAWIIAFAPAVDPVVAVAVIVEGTPGFSEQSGGRFAAPIAKAVIEAVLAAPPAAGDPGAEGAGG